jgi:hypothetical protein
MTDRPQFTPTNTEDAEQLVAEARSLRRRLLFWKRLGFFVLGLALFLAFLSWQRTTIRCRECVEALQRYTGMAQQARLETSVAETLQSQWEHFARGPVKLDAAHYLLIPENWRQIPAAGESLPLAICRDSHVSFIARGRYVLYRDAQSHITIKWLSEEEAAPILARAKRERA